MRCLVSVLSLAAVTLFAWPASDVLAQATKTARGTVTAMAGDAIAVKAGDSQLKLTVDAKTTVTAEGATTATREAQQAGKPGAALSGLIKVGDAVEVTYTETGGALRATSIRRIRDAGPGGGTTSDQRSETVSGTVDSISANTLTISGSRGGGATFKQSFSVDTATTVVAEGAGTAAAARGGKLILTEHLGSGDRVTVTYRKLKDTLHATEIRVTQKAKK